MLRTASNSGAVNTDRRGLAIVVAAVSCAVAIGACGSSGPSQRSGGRIAKGALVADSFNFSECMRSHGVPNYPDPKVSGHGVQLGAPGINPQSPAFQSAQQSCRHLLPVGSAHPTAHETAQMLHVSQCMRQHGVTGFPDPTQSSPSNPADYSAVVDRNGVVLAIPKSIDVNSPAFKQAATACNFGAAT